MTRHPLLHGVLGLVLGGVFLYASVDKIESPKAFARIVYHYQILGPNGTLSPLLPNSLAVILPWVEALTGVLLAVGVLRREAAAVAALLLATFVLAVGSALYRGIDIENCGCFRVTGPGRRAGGVLLAEDLALLGGALFLVVHPPRRRASAPQGLGSGVADRALTTHRGPA